MIKIIIAEDHQLVRKSLELLLNTRADIEVVATVSSAKDLYELLDKGVKTDIVLSDVMMPNVNGIAMISEVNKYDRSIKLVMLSMHEDLVFVQQAFEAGAFGYLSKDVDENELIFALKQVKNNYRYLSSELSIEVLKKFKHLLKMNGNKSDNMFPLSERETLVLNMIADGMTNQEISDKIFLSRRTVEGIRQGLLDKSGCRNSASLIRFSVRNNYIT